jgi:hypothetical protein
MIKRTIDVDTIGESMVLFQPMSEGKLAYINMFGRTIAGAESNVAIIRALRKKTSQIRLVFFSLIFSQIILSLRLLVQILQIQLQ